MSKNRRSEKYRSNALASIHETMEALDKVGALDIYPGQHLAEELEELHLSAPS